MKIKTIHYPIIAGYEPVIPPKIAQFIASSDQAREYREGYSQLLACRHYRALSGSILTHLGGQPNLLSQLRQMAPQAKIEPCWYLYRGLAIGLARVALDLVFTCVVRDYDMLLYGGVFTDMGDKGTDEDIHYDLCEMEGSPENLRDFSTYMGVLLPTFLEFADIETIIINSAMPGKRKGEIGGEKYITDIPLDIEIIDSTWYRTLMHDAEFGVSGHFRLQPYGPGLASRRLIYIKDFIKHGYRRQARKDRQINDKGTINGS